MLRGLSLAVLFLGVTANASAATFLADAVCVDSIRHPSEGIGEVNTSCGPVIDYPVTRFSPAGTASADSFARASAGPAGLRLSATHILSVEGAKSGQGGQSTQTYAAWNFDDFVVTGPGSMPVPAALHLFVSGSMSGGGFTDDQGSLTSSVSGKGDFFIEIEINGADAGHPQAFYNFFNGTIQEGADGLLEGHVHGGAISDIITSDQLMLPVGVYSVQVEVFANASGVVRIMGTPADEFDSVSAGAYGLSEFQSTVSFPTSGPVFDLPPGYTVNSVSAGIVNNRLVPEPSALVPEPSALWLLAAGAGGLCAARRRFSGARPSKS